MRKKRSAPLTKVEVFEVGPRDGLQSEKKIFTVEERLELVRLLVRTGLRRIEVGSFVKADRIPQLESTDLLLSRLKKESFKGFSPQFWAFVPNEYGLERAVEAGIDGMSFFVASSETFCQKNVNRSKSELMRELKKLLPLARKKKTKTRVYLSTLVFCPYEGKVSVGAVAKIVDQLLDAGATEVVLSDTTGHANPLSLRKVLEKCLDIGQASQFALHLHDTRGLALANVLEGIAHGISVFDSSVGGLGGCPYAPGASGNLASEDLVNMLLGMGLLKKIDLGALANAARFAEKVLGHEVPSKVLRTL